MGEQSGELMAARVPVWGSLVSRDLSDLWQIGRNEWKASPGRQAANFWTAVGMTSRDARWSIDAKKRQNISAPTQDLKSSTHTRPVAKRRAQRGLRTPTVIALVAVHGGALAVGSPPGPEVRQGWSYS